MAEKRYKVIRVDEPRIWMPNCPVQIDKYQLLLDTVNDSVLLRVKFFNLSDVVIKSVYLKVVCYDDTGDNVSEIDDIAVQNVNAKPHTEFGKDNLITLNTNKAAKVNIIVEKIALANDEVWRNEGIRSIPIPSLARINENEYSEQIIRELKDARLTGQYIYTDFGDRWVCTCGQLNENTKECCGRCLINREWQVSHFDKEYLTLKTAEYKAECERIAENKRKGQIYFSAQSTQEIGTEKAYREAAELFLSIKDYEDSSDMANKSLEKADLIHIKEEKKKKHKKRFKIVLLVSTILLIVVALIVLTVIYAIIPSNKYNNALEMQENGEYDQAIIAFTELGYYRDSETQIDETKYLKAIDLQGTGNYNEAISLFVELNSYKDSADQLIETKYQYAMEMMVAGNYDISISLFTEISEYKDSAEKINESTKKIFNYQGFSVGNIIKFGTYEQDNNLSDGREKIEWIILAVKSNKLLLISKYSLDCSTYNNIDEWLYDFQSNAFSPSESFITNEIFILKESDINLYFPDISSRVTQATYYAISRGAYINGSNCIWWMMKSSEYNAVSNKGGYINCELDSDFITIRPAIWIDLS